MWRFTAERVPRTAYAVLVACGYFGFPIVALVPVLIGMPSRSISVAYRVLIAAGSVGYVVWAAQKRRAAFTAPLQWAVGLLTLLLLMRLAWDSYIAQLPLDLSWDVMWAEVPAFTLIPALPFLLLPDLESLATARSLGRWAAFAAVVAVGLGAMYSVRHVTSANRLATDVINPITIGEIGVSLFIFALSYSSTAGPVRTAWWRTSARVAAGAIGIGVCVLSASKGPLLSLGAVILVMFSYRFSRLPLRRRVEESCAALALVALVAVVTATLNQHGALTIYARIADFASDQSTVSRLQAWDGALAQFNASPLWGSAAVELSTRFYPHNAILEVMMATGVCGLMLLLLLQAWAVIAGHSILKQAPEYSWVPLLFLQRAVGSLFSGSIYMSGTTWISLLMLLGLYQSLAAARAVESPRLGAGAHA